MYLQRMSKMTNDANRYNPKLREWVDKRLRSKKDYEIRRENLQAEVYRAKIQYKRYKRHRKNIVGNIELALLCTKNMNDCLGLITYCDELTKQLDEKWTAIDKPKE